MRPLLAVLLALAVSVAAGGDPAIETFPLRHRLPEDVIPVLRPLLGPEDALSASGNTLILRASPETVAQIRKLLPTLDRPIQSLMISLRDIGTAEASAGGYSGSVRIASSDTTPQGDVRIKGYRRRYSNRVGGTSQLRAMDGHPAFIETGKLIPYYSGPLFLYGTATVTFRDASSGFWVVPRIHSDQVTLEIATQAARPTIRGDGSLDHQQVATRIQTKMGEWFTVAGTDQSIARQRHSGVVYRTHRDDQDNRLIQLKVDPVGRN